MQEHSFVSFDIDSFYPSITKPLLSKAISFAKNYTTIRDKDIDIIMHCRKSLLFDKETAWTKKNHSDMFDVTMGSFDGAEVCELIGLFLLNILSEKYGKNNVGLYRDDGLVLLKICNFLDVTLNLSDGTYYPYGKPNNETLYIDSNSNHPPTIIKHLLAAIGRRISDICGTARFVPANNISPKFIRVHESFLSLKLLSAKCVAVRMMTFHYSAVQVT